MYIIHGPKFNPNLYYIQKISNFQERKFQKYQGKLKKSDEIFGNMYFKIIWEYLKNIFKVESSKLIN